MSQNIHQYPIVFFTLDETFESITQNRRNLEFDDNDEMLEWALKEKGFFCEVSFAKKWEKPLVIAMGDYGVEMPTEELCKEACESIGLKFDRWDTGYYTSHT